MDGAGEKNPSGHFVKDLGMAGDRATEIAAILLEHDVSTFPSPRQLAELPKEGEKLASSGGILDGTR